jgi:hypothetical protein
MFSPSADLLVALAWVPVFVLAHAATRRHGPGADSSIRTMLDGALVLSFLHQPLTLALVYGDRRRFDGHRRLFLVGPVVATAVIVTILRLHEAALIVPVAAVWNTVHTLQQRYGLSRVYSRKAGYGSARLDRAVLYVWMGAALLAVAAARETTALITRLSLDDTTRKSVTLLTRLRPYAAVALVPAIVASLVIAGRLVHQERQAAHPNPAKWLYQASSLALIATIAIDPAAGFVAYVAAHAFEYVVVVYKTAHRDATSARSTGTARGLPWLAGSMPGRVLAVGGVMGAAFLVHLRVAGDAYNAILFTVGALHFTFDGAIWKLRRQPVAAAFSIAARAAPTTT